jgi:hypothetical protein
VPGRASRRSHQRHEARSTASFIASWERIVDPFREANLLGLPN